MWPRSFFGRLPAPVAAFTPLLLIPLLIVACAPHLSPFDRSAAEGTLSAENTALVAELQHLRATNDALLAANGTLIPPVTPPPGLPFADNPPDSLALPPPFLGGPATIVSENPFPPPPPTPQPPAIGMVLTPTRDPNMPTFDPNRRSMPIVETATAQELDRRVRMTATALHHLYLMLTPRPEPRNQTATSIAATIIASSATPRPPDFRLELAADPIFTEVEDCDAQVIAGTISGILGREVLVRVVGGGIDRVRVTDGATWEIPVADEPTAATYTLTVLTLDNQLVSEAIAVGFDGRCERAAAEVNFTVYRDSATVTPTSTRLPPRSSRTPTFTPAPPTPVP